MDPFSIIVGTIGLIDVSLRVGKRLNKLREAVTSTKDDLNTLSQQITAITSASESIKRSFEYEIDNSAAGVRSKAPEVDKLWQHVSITLQACGKRIGDLEDLIEQITGGRDSDEIINADSRRRSNTIENWKLQLRKLQVNSRFEQIQSDLKGFKDTLGLQLNIIGLIYQKESNFSSEQLAEAIGRLSIQVATLNLSSLPSYGVDLQESVKSTNAPISSLPPNKYFYPPHGVSSLYTGRESEATQLESILLNEKPKMSRCQKRFIIYGVEGSGKTEFCSKFADDFRNRFLAVFTVDASSEERAETSFSQIAMRGGGEHHKRAGINWLSNLEEPWLLIIDNADDPTLDPETLFPEGERGHILVTTRNPAHKIYGTVGSGSFQFSGLEPDAACTLLLKATGEGTSWNLQKQRSAITITELLGYLPLALIHAGKSIRSRRCSLQDFIPYFNRTRQRVLHARVDQINVQKPRAKDSAYDINVFATYELLYRDLLETGTPESANAIELLNMFAFFHRDNIREDILFKAAANPILEKEVREKMSSPAGKYTLNRTFISRSLKELYIYFFKITRGPPVIPRVLRDVEDLEDVHEDRIRAALSELSARSLIIYNESDRSYYIHPLVHIWIRERPEMKTSEQAIWCQAAATTLARAIILPIGELGNTETDAEFRRSLLNHVRHVQKCQMGIQQQMTRNSQRSRSRFWVAPSEILDDRQAGQIARFSIVYAECGHMHDAERLQKQAKEFFCNLLGPDHPISCLLQINLSKTYWVLGRPAEAAELQETVLAVHCKSKGAESYEALSVMDMLGSSYFHQCRFTDALNLHKKALAGMRMTLGDDCAETMKAMMNVGLMHSKFFRFDISKTMLEEASENLSRKFGSDHPEALIARENLAMVYHQLGGDFVERAHMIMLDVLEKRKLKLGREHPFTLLAMCHLARTKASLGEFELAERIMLEGLAVAGRNLGQLHIGTLYGRTCLGQMLRLEGRLKEAERVLETTIENYTHMAAARNREHSDRIIAMQSLIECYREQDKIEEAIQVARRAMDGLTVMGGLDHPFVSRMEEKLEELLQIRREKAFPEVAEASEKRLQGNLAEKREIVKMGTW